LPPINSAKLVRQHQGKLVGGLVRFIADSSRNAISC
jgi:hypothetical protein